MKQKALKFEKQEIEKSLKEIKDRIVGSFNPVKIILFGSYAYGMPHKFSDVDRCPWTSSLKTSSQYVDIFKNMIQDIVLKQQGRQDGRGENQTIFN